MVIQFPCGICLKAVANNHQVINCDKCNLWIHIKCNAINKQTYNYLKPDCSHWFCISYTKEFLSFSGIEDGEFIYGTLGKKVKFAHVWNTPNSIRENFIQTTNSENNSSQYFTLNDLIALSYDKNIDFSVFHLNIDFQILCISESKLKTDISMTTNIQLPEFNIEHMQTKSGNGGVLLYIRDTVNYNLRPELNVEKEKELESFFMEILQKAFNNVIICCIYRHPCMHLIEFDYLFLKSLTERLPLLLQL